MNILALDDKIVDISLGSAHSSAVSSTGRVFTWGSNSSGRLGDGTTTSKSVPTEITFRFSLAAGDKIVSTSLGGSHSSAVSSTGRVFTWGDNEHGKLGLYKDTFDGYSNSPSAVSLLWFNLAAGDKIVSLSLGGTHSSAISSTGRVFIWGANSSGQLGDGTTTSKSVPTEITSRFSLATGDKIVSMSLGSSHSSAISSTGRVFTWGRNDVGRLGDGSTSDKLTPTDITSSFALDSNDNIVIISLGVQHSSAISSTGRVFTWGSNAKGQLGTNSTTNRLTPTEITSNFNLVTEDKIVSMSLGGDFASGNYYSSAVSSTGRVFTWGANNLGQLGDGSTSDKSIPTEITSSFALAAGDRILNLSLGISQSSISGHSSAISSTGRVFTWGNNGNGQLGDGTTGSSNNKLVPTIIHPGASTLIQTSTHQFGSSIVEASLPVDTGYSFTGWYEPSNITTPYVFTTMPGRDLNLYSFKTPND
jgi:uncharacterized repeat protein (TIGR02543 family)